jgi:predicted DNA-binding transcriptional regulator AlpA
LRKLVKRGLFPAPRQVSDNRIAWRLGDIIEWKRQRPVPVWVTKPKIRKDAR